MLPCLGSGRRNFQVQPGKKVQPELKMRQLTVHQNSIENGKIYPQPSRAEPREIEDEVTHSASKFESKLENLTAIIIWYHKDQSWISKGSRFITRINCFICISWNNGTFWSQHWYFSFLLEKFFEISVKKYFLNDCSQESHYKIINW